ncbi:MAG: recombination regulator RecX [Legionella sp.]|nr:MAG: recombination regulator RecX [Legionella sp.]PJD98993.1 MAG: recombination regulator RecX [Legionella sp.]
MTKAQECALRLLTRREHSTKELKEKLKQKGFLQEEIEAALVYCQHLNYQCDSRFTASYMRSRIAQGYGPLKILHELKQKGVEASLIEKELGKEQENWYSYAFNVWQKKYKGKKPSSFIEVQKQQQFLLYRGFDRDIIIKVIKNQ